MLRGRDPVASPTPWWPLQPRDRSAAGYATFAGGKRQLTRDGAMHDAADRRSWSIQRGFDRRSPVQAVTHTPGDRSLLARATRESARVYG